MSSKGSYVIVRYCGIVNDAQGFTVVLYEGGISPPLGKKSPVFEIHLAFFVECYSDHSRRSLSRFCPDSQRGGIIQFLARTEEQERGLGAEYILAVGTVSYGTVQPHGNARRAACGSRAAAWPPNRTECACERASEPVYVHVRARTCAHMFVHVLTHSHIIRNKAGFPSQQCNLLPNGTTESYSPESRFTNSTLF